jgi:hypothetical protein
MWERRSHTGRLKGQPGSVVDTLKAPGSCCLGHGAAQCAATAGADFHHRFTSLHFHDDRPPYPFPDSNHQHPSHHPNHLRTNPRNPKPSPLSSNPIFSKTIATDRLPLAAARLSGTRDRRQMLWRGCE